MLELKGDEAAGMLQEMESFEQTAKYLLEVKGDEAAGILQERESYEQVVHLECARSVN